MNRILVGAPNAETRQPGVRRPGGVYRCSCERNDVCQLVPFDRAGIMYKHINIYTHKIQYTLHSFNLQTIHNYIHIILYEILNTHTMSLQFTCN